LAEAPLLRERDAREISTHFGKMEEEIFENQNQRKRH